jgi:signal transduction histidine kinase/DNA-binding NarL/FixJ family response regulator
MTQLRSPAPPVSSTTAVAATSPATSTTSATPAAPAAPATPEPDTRRVWVSVVEDHPLYRAALARVLEEADDIELDVVADSVGRFAASRPRAQNVVVLDLKLQGVHDAAAVLQVTGMGHRVLVVSAHAGQSDVLGAISAGARGYLSKEADGAEILRAIREIAAGNSYVSPTLASFVLNATRDRHAGPSIELSPQERHVRAGPEHQRSYGQVLPGPHQGQDRRAAARRHDQGRHRDGHSHRAVQVTMNTANKACGVSAADPAAAPVPEGSGGPMLDQPRSGDSSSTGLDADTAAPADAAGAGNTGSNAAASDAPTSDSATGPPPPFLTALLRGGAPVIAAVPDRMPDEVVDPAPMPAWRRISMLSAPVPHAESDTLLSRACRYVMLLPLAYRIGAMPVALLLYLNGAHGPAVFGAVLTTVLGVFLSVLTAVWILRMPGFLSSTARWVVTVDTAVAIVANLALAEVCSPGSFSATGVSWQYLAGSVALWTLARGVPTGLLGVLFGGPLHLSMVTLASGSGAPGTAVFVGRELILLAALLVCTCGLILLGVGVRLALAVGARHGVELAHSKIRRGLHDTVLQTLEAMALTPPGDTDDAPARLRELRGIAHAQAVELRRDLRDLFDAPSTEPAGLVEDLAEIATRMAREGLRAQLVAEDFDDSLDTARRLAIRDAVREALRNTLRHSGTTEVVLRVEERGGGIAVTARDFGAGFDERGHEPGFGISESIAARVKEVGGSMSIDSSLGSGTRVTLWVPR